jgi:hypothetical protein
MAGELQTTILVPRFSSFTGAGTYRTVGINVTEHAAARVHIWRGPLVGTTPTVSFAIEESIDQENWTTCDGDDTDDPGAGVEAVYDLTLKKRWLRAVVTLGGTDPGATVWIVAELERREG